MMKRMICLCVMCLLLSGCGTVQEKPEEPVSFYFYQKEYRFEEQRTVIVSEQRDASGHRDNLSYMMALYLMGPVNDSYLSPIPRGTRIFVKEEPNGEIILTLSDTAKAMTDAQFSLACSCLTLTCQGITGAEEITVVNGDRVISMSKENLTLFDSPAQIQPTEETQ